MDNIIQILPETLINQIAAGEVVVRPSSVVKELIENAIDANARMIHVEIADGGRSLIRVLDNGIGMTREDAILSLERHATSKLRGSEDLQNILTLGFRGEALPSIASVSRFELRTRRDGADVGVKISMEGGTNTEIQEIACNTGTEVRVRDLFFNVPARLKFMKTEKIELQHITELIGTFAIGYRQILFRLISNGKTIYDFPPDAHLQDRMVSVLGRSCARRMFPIALDQPVLVRGYISEPTLSKKGTAGIFTFINGRAVYDKLLYQALRSAYGNMLDTGRYPYGVLFLELSPDRIDVNVHPTKNEVRFQNPSEAFQAVHRACTMMLAVAPWKKEMPDKAGNEGEDIRGKGPNLSMWTDPNRREIWPFREIPASISASRDT